MFIVVGRSMWNIFLNVFKPDIHCVYILHSSYSLSDMNENNLRIIVFFFSLYIHTWPRGYITFFILNSAEHDIYPAHKC